MTPTCQHAHPANRWMKAYLDCIVELLELKLLLANLNDAGFETAFPSHELQVSE